MQRLRAYWRSGWIAKAVLLMAGSSALVMGCCVLGLAIGALAPRRAAIQATTAPAVAQPAIEETSPTATLTQEPTEPPQPTATPVPTEAPTDRRTVRKEDYGDAWPFTVDQGVVRCVMPKREIVFSSGGKPYAVNGTAKANKLYGDIGQIWRDNPAIEGTKIDISPILNLGLSLC